MMERMVGTLTPDGMRFGLTSAGRHYLCAIWHRGAGDPSKKTVWIITHDEEYTLFCDAEGSDWKDAPGNYWGLKKGAPPLGQDDERIAKFPVPQNDHDPWHGYPVKSGSDKPPMELIDLWCDKSLISKAQKKNLKKGWI